MTSLRNDPLSHDRAPSHAKPAIPRAAEIAERIEAGETVADVAASIGRTTATLRQHLLDHGWDSETARPLASATPRTTEARRLYDLPAWFDGAVCAQIGGDDWLPERGGSVTDAKRMCGSCDVRADCLEWALANDEQWGVFGGLSPRQRRKVKQERASA